MSASFRILSHAGLLVSGGGKHLIFDPWLVGSAYWRSWWNYPPVPAGTLAGLRADFIYLTHIHWDHFHGPTLRKFPRETPILIPRVSGRRMRKDLEAMGFMDIRELRHGEGAELAPGLKVTSYHFFPFNDSGAVVEADGTVLFNANDAKFMGGPLEQILRRHPRIDFVFRSHSSANERMCFDYIDEPGLHREDPGRYLDAFAAFADKVGARYAVPFASNHCYLHRETFHLNDTVVTPGQVEAYSRVWKRSRPLSRFETKAMVAGDAWSAETGFAIADGPWFRDRDLCLARYAAAEADRLARFYKLEDSVDVSLEQVDAYFRRFRAAVPGFILSRFKGRPITLVLSGKTLRRFWVDLERGVVREVGGVDDENHPLQIYTSSYIFRRCMALDLFLYLGIAKRVLFRVRRADAKWINLLLLLFNLYECEMLPATNLLAPRFWGAWLPRWREALLYGRIAMRKALGHPFKMEDYLRRPATRAAQDARSQIRTPERIIRLKRLESTV
jgi:UDP-MurNAc hydroxylase